MSSNCVQETQKVESETPPNDPYILWQRQHKIALFQGGGTWWRRYRDILVPASTKPEPVFLGASEARELLRESRAYLLRWFTRTSDAPTEFWYVVCDDYNFEKLPGKMRTKIRRAYRDCIVRQIQPGWLAESGYDCYLAAFSRYKAATPASKNMFQKECLRCIDGPFEFWGAFIGETLVGFAKCILGRDYVTMVVFKIHPKYMSSRPAYALQDMVLQTYVTRAGKPVNNGFRSLAHDTNMQDFVLQFGFKRIYTDLRILYRPPLQSLIAVLYPFNFVISRFPAFRPIEYLKTLLKQEQIRRSCLHSP
jgi:hypothetical protein